MISLFMPSHVQIVKARNMYTQTDSLWKIIHDFKTWEQWNTIVPGLAEQNPEYSENKLQAKNIMVKWIGEPHPVSRFAVIERKTGKQILTGWKVANDIKTDSVMVQWLIGIQLRWYPWEKFAGMLYEKSYGDKLSEGLDRLKNLVENKSSSY
jgi:hypothetical protein